MNLFNYMIDLSSTLSFQDICIMAMGAIGILAVLLGSLSAQTETISAWVYMVIVISRMDKIETSTLIFLFFISSAITIFLLWEQSSREKDKTDFKQKIQARVDRINAMQAKFERERKEETKKWIEEQAQAKRDEEQKRADAIRIKQMKRNANLNLNIKKRK